MSGSLLFTILHADGRHDEVAVDSDRARVGSGPHCEIRLPVEQAELEHVVVFIHKGVVYAETRAQDVRVKGRPFTRGPLPPDAVVAIRQTQFSAAMVSRDHAVQKVRSKAKTVRSYLLATLFFVLLAVYLFRPRGAKAQMVMRDPPELFGNAQVACPQKASEPALQLASDLLVLADSKRERAPFFPQAGVAAVSLYQEAAACFTVAGKRQEAAQAGDDAKVLARHLADEFKLAALRLERALSKQDWQMASEQTPRLKAFLEGQAGEYVAWLNEMERRSIINLTHNPEKKKKKYER
jgi:hypothetical protein